MQCCRVALFAALRQFVQPAITTTFLIQEPTCANYAQISRTVSNATTQPAAQNAQWDSTNWLESARHAIQTVWHVSAHPQTAPNAQKVGT